MLTRCTGVHCRPSLLARRVVGAVLVVAGFVGVAVEAVAAKLAHRKDFLTAIVILTAAAVLACGLHLLSPRKESSR